MNKYLETVLEHAKQFDDEYIKTSETDLFCPNEAVIKNYIIAKSVITPDLKISIIIDPVEMPAMQAEFKDILTKTGLDKKWDKKATIKDNIIFFKNDSLIYFSGYEKPADRFKNTIMKVIYVSNTALDSLKGLGNLEKNFKGMADDDTRMIYNFEE